LKSNDQPLQLCLRLSQLLAQQLREQQEQQVIADSIREYNQLQQEQQQAQVANCTVCTQERERIERMVALFEAGIRHVELRARQVEEAADSAREERDACAALKREIEDLQQGQQAAMEIIAGMQARLEEKERQQKLPVQKQQQVEKMGIVSWFAAVFCVLFVVGVLYNQDPELVSYLAVASGESFLHMLAGCWKFLLHVLDFWF